MIDLLAVLGIAALALLLAVAPASEQQIATEKAIASQVSRDKALATVRSLVACGVRAGGTDSGRCAADLIGVELMSLGLAVEKIADPPIPFWEATSFGVDVDGATLASAWPNAGSPSMNRAQMLLVSEGADRAAWKGAAVLSRRRAREIYEEAVAAGASAILSWHPADPKSHVSWAAAGRLGSSPSKTYPIPAFNLSNVEGRGLDARLAAGAAPLSLAIQIRALAGEGSPLTMVGTLAGGGLLAANAIMVCAHGDSDGLGPGADDNASGVAALLEVARALTWAGSQGLLPVSRPRILFAVWGAEYHSSEAWLRVHPEEAPRLRAVFNYDQAGFGAERDAVYYEGNDVPWNERLLRTIESVASDHASEEGFPAHYTSNPTMGGTDMYVFLPRRFKGIGITESEIPVTTVFASAWGEAHHLKQTAGWISKGWPEGEALFIDYAPAYHSAGDTPANTTEREPDNMVRCARLVAASILRLMRG